MASVQILGMKRNKSAEFVLPVDSEHKAAVFRPWKIKGVHMTSFHVSWVSVFVSFMSMFAPAALVPVIRDDIDLTTRDIGAAGIAAVSGVISARIVMGVMCDTIGPRYGHAGLMLLTAPAMFGMSLVSNDAEFIVCRFIIGFSLATFVACQYWSSVMFNVKIIGVANGTGAGWGNAGGGFTHLLMPWIYNAFAQSHEDFLAWRLAFFIPGCMHIVIAFVVLVFAQDMPDGSFFKLRSRGNLAKPGMWNATKTGLTNWRAWLMAWLYGYSFGIELTFENVAVQYFTDDFDMSLTTAGVVASMFGLLNVFARTLGGLFSDHIAKEYGMRGRLAVYWLLQTLQGALCIFVGLAVNSLGVTILLMILFSMFVQSSEGAGFGIVPFISGRALGAVTGLVGAGGNAGAVIMHFLFFHTERLDTNLGFVYMGITVLAMSQLIFLMSFPQWGGILSQPNPDVSEEDYYLREYTEDEIAQGLANSALVFAEETKAQRGGKRLARDLEAVRSSSKRSLGVSSSSQVEISKMDAGMAY